MTAIHAVELEWIAAIQGNGRFHELMSWFSYLGSEAVPYVLAFVYFVISPRSAARLYLLVPLSGLLNHVLKLSFHSPRPFWIDTRIHALCSWAGYGLPSGHVLTASVVWPSVARALHTRWASFGAVSAVLLVSVSRVYLGVHFISDVIAAWAIGIMLVLSFELLERKTWTVIQSSSTYMQIGFTLWGTAILIVLG